MGSERQYIQRTPNSQHDTAIHGATSLRGSVTKPARPQYSVSLENIQAKLKINRIDDQFELEADRTADAVMSGSPPPHVTPVDGAAVQSKCADCEDEETNLQRKENGMAAAAGPGESSAGASGAGVSGAGVSGDGGSHGGRPSIEGGLGTGGTSLPKEQRGFFERRMGADFSNVRIHNDSAAARMSRSINARAFTHGRDIYFNSGEYSPNTVGGQHLLAHELAHTLQQGAAKGVVQRKKGDGGRKEPRHAERPYRVKIKSKLGEAELLQALKAQYPGLGNLTWSSFVPITDAQVAAGYVWILVTDASIAAFTAEEDRQNRERWNKLTPEQRASIEAETERRMNSRVPNGSGKGGTSDVVARYREALRDDLLRKRIRIEALPQDILAILLGEGSQMNLTPEQYEKALEIARRLQELSPEQLAEYRSRVTEGTHDLDVVAAAVDSFIREISRRESTTQQRRTIETRLYGLDELYSRYRQYLSLLKTSATLANTQDPQGAGTAMGMQSTLNEMREELDRDLRIAGFNGGLAEFEEMIRQYEQVFEKETLALANVLLDQYERRLMLEERRYTDDNTITALHGAIAASGARADYDNAEKIRNEHASGAFFSPDDVEREAYWLQKYHEAGNRADSAVRSASSGHETIQEKEFDRKKLAAASPQEVRAVLLDYLAQRRADIETTRKGLAEDPTMIYGLDLLLQASYQTLGLQHGTLRERIITDHIEDVNWKKVIDTVVLAVVAIAAGLVSAGGGTYAILGGSVALGIGSYQALEEFRRYEMGTAAYGAKLASDDPDFAWVIVAVIGAGIDAAAFASAFKLIRPAVQAFNEGPEAGNVLALERRLHEIAGVEERMQKAIVRAADARVREQAAWRAIVEAPTSLRAAIVPGAEEFGKLVYAVYLTARRKVFDFEAFVATREAADVIGDLAIRAPEELAALKVGFTQASGEVQELTAYGRKLGLLDEDIDEIFEARALTPGMTAEQAKADMRAMRADAKDVAGTSAPRPLRNSSDAQARATARKYDMYHNIDKKRVLAVDEAAVLNEELLRGATNAGRDPVVGEQRIARFFGKKKASKPLPEFFTWRKDGKIVPVEVKNQKEADIGNVVASFRTIAEWVRTTDAIPIPGGRDVRRAIHEFVLYTRTTTLKDALFGIADGYLVKDGTRYLIEGIPVRVRVHELPAQQ